MTQRRRDRNAPGIAANAKAAIAAEIAFAVEHRQAGQLDREGFSGAIDRPVNDEAAPGVA